MALAKKVGREIWERFRIPVYFYEAAAQRPERTNLEAIRKGPIRRPARRSSAQSPIVRRTLANNAFIPLAPGATVVGARKFLIAYNINLNTSDISIANLSASARTFLRFSNGGLRFVKAMGVDLRGRNLAQVSINLTDFEQTPIHRVFEMVKREAERYGVSIVGSEIVGLIPKAGNRADRRLYILQLRKTSHRRRSV